MAGLVSVRLGKSSCSWLSWRPFQVLRHGQPVKRALRTPTLNTAWNLSRESD